MIEREDIIRIVGEGLAEMEGLFLVDVKTHGDEIEVFVDADGVDSDGRPRRVAIDDCAALTRVVEAHLTSDFSLTVSSSGIGQPLRVLRQYRKLVGHLVEVVFVGGTKLIATLEGVDSVDGAQQAAITLSYSEKQRLEGEKRPRAVAVTKTFPLSDIKTTTEYIDFK